jgi:hypothetical protein
MTFIKHKTPFYPRGPESKQRGAELMALSAARSGQPSDNSIPVPMTDFNKRKIKESEAAARAAERGTLSSKPATDARKTREHFSPRKGR